MKDQSAAVLTVCVSCGRRPDLLKKNLQALDRQTLDKNLWNLALLFQPPSAPVSLKVFSLSPELTVKTLIPPRKLPVDELRNLAFQEIKSPILFFIDEDVILKNTDHLKTLVHLHKQEPEGTVLGGGYLSPPECSFYGRVYNWISRVWMLENPGFVPAGNLSVKTSHLDFSCRFKSPLQKGFGGEEIYFLNQIRRLGLRSFRKTELDAFHTARHTLKEFLGRAVLHGQSRAFQEPSVSFFKSVACFMKCPASPPVKTVGFFYLCLVRFTALLYKAYFAGKRSRSV